jgi:diaminopimelate epimerase
MMFAAPGVPHLVIGVDDIEQVDPAGRGRALRHHPSLGPAGANVNFVARSSAEASRWLIRTYERGVEAETLACGTGTVAAALSLAVRAEADLPVVFRSRGGPELRVEGALGSATATGVWLGGEGRLVYEGLWKSTTYKSIPR